MEPISIISARVIWILNTLDLNPKGVRLLPQLTDALINAYDFDEPADEPRQQPNTVKLKDGMFEKGGEGYRVGLEIFDDGFVADSSHSTELTEEFLNHVVEWGKTNFRIKFSPDLVMRKAYFSEVAVRFHSQIATAIKPFTEFSSLLAKAMSSAAEADDFALSALTFSTRIPIGNAAKALSIERRANTAPEANIFYCKAPLPTQELLTLLALFDDL